MTEANLPASTRRIKVLTGVGNWKYSDFLLYKINTKSFEAIYDLIGPIVVAVLYFKRVLRLRTIKQILMGSFFFFLRMVRGGAERHHLL